MNSPLSFLSPGAPPTIMPNISIWVADKLIKESDYFVSSESGYKEGGVFCHISLLNLRKLARPPHPRLSRYLTMSWFQSTRY